LVAALPSVAIDERKPYGRPVASDNGKMTHIGPYRRDPIAAWLTRMRRRCEQP